MMAKCVKKTKGAQCKLWDLGAGRWVSTMHLFRCLILFVIKSRSIMEKKTWIPLLALMHMASKDPCSPLAHLYSLIPPRTSLHISLHAVAPRTFFFYFLKLTTYLLGAQDLSPLKTPLPFSSQITSQTFIQAAFLWYLLSLPPAPTLTPTLGLLF